MRLLEKNLIVPLLSYEGTCFIFQVKASYGMLSLSFWSNLTWSCLKTFWFSVVHTNWEKPFSVLFHLLAWLGRQCPVLKHLSSLRSPTAQGLGVKASDAGLDSGFASWLCDLRQVIELQLTVLICKIWIITYLIGLLEDYMSWFMLKLLRAQEKKHQKMLWFLLKISVKHFSGIDDITIKIYLDLTQKKRKKILKSSFPFFSYLYCYQTWGSEYKCKRGSTGITSSCS